MADKTAKTNGSSPGLGRLFQGILEDTETLAKDHLKLARAEIKEDFRDVREGVLSLAVAGGGLLVGAFLFSLALAYLLVETTKMPMWASLGIVSLVVSAIGGILFYRARTHLDEAKPPIETTQETLKEDAQWLTNQK